MKQKSILNFFSLAICLAIVLHHYIKHINDFHLTDHEKFFQISDVSNHRSFVFLFLGVFIGLMMSKIV